MIYAGVALLELVTADLNLLGESKLVRDNDARTYSDFEPGVLADMVRAHNRQYSYPFLRDDISALVKQVNGSVVELVKTVLDDDELAVIATVDLADFPVSALASRRSARTVNIGFEIADGHLHSGGSMPVDVFLQAVGVRSKPIESKLKLHGATGQCWHLAPLLAGMRFLMRSVQYFSVYGSWPSDPEATGLSAEWLHKVRNGTFWAHIRQLCLADPNFETHDGAELNRSMPRVANPGPLFGTIMTLSAIDGVDTEARISLVLGVLRAVVALHGVLTSRAGEGLTRFSERFAMLGDAKSIARDPAITEIKKRLLVSTIDRLAPTEEVVGLEFRSTVDKTDYKAFKRGVSEDLSEHCDAFASVLSSRTSGLALSMPVGFRRKRSDDLDPAFVGLVELRSVVAGVGALSSINSGESGKKKIDAIWSIDVADDELGSNNWPYCVGAGLLQDKGIDLKFTIHAGESFYTKLNGIRRVGELFVGCVPPYRIGHALALSDTASSAILDRTTPRITTFDAIIDLAWLAWTKLDSSGDVESVLYQLLAPPSGIQPLSVNEVVAAFAKLHDHRFVAATLLTETAGRMSVLTADDLHAYSSAGSSMRTFLHLAGALLGVEDYGFGRLVRGHVLDSYCSIADRNIDSCRDLVFDFVRNAGTTLEACPTSNLLLSGMKGAYGRHPATRWVSNRNCRVSVSSDDPFLFSVTVLDEFAALKGAGVPPEVLAQLGADSVATCSGGGPRRLWSADDFEAVKASCAR